MRCENRTKMPILLSFLELDQSHSTQIIPFIIVESMKTSRERSYSAILEILLLFTPAIPAYLWIWPNIEGTRWYEPFNIVTYLYFLGGSLLIGLRRWNRDQLGLNRKGIILSLLFGLLFIIGRTLAYISINLPLEFQSFSITRIVGEILFYFGLVGFIEELLFRGLIYRILEDLHGARLAIWGSALAFGIYHIGSQGPLGAIGTAIIGLIFAVIRRRAGGIWGLVFTHGLLDFIAVETQPSLEMTQIQQIQIEQPILLVLSYILLLGPVIYLWKGYHSTNGFEE